MSSQLTLARDAMYRADWKALWRLVAESHPYDVEMLEHYLAGHGVPPLSEVHQATVATYLQSITAGWSIHRLTGLTITIRRAGTSRTPVFYAVKDGLWKRGIPVRSSAVMRVPWAGELGMNEHHHLGAVEPRNGQRAALREGRWGVA